MVKIIMDNGNEYKDKRDINEIQNLLHDRTNLGELKLKNYLVEIDKNNLINPSHISSIELSGSDKRKAKQDNLDMQKYHEDLAKKITED